MISCGTNRTGTRAGDSNMHSAGVATRAFERTVVAEGLTETHSFGKL